MLNYQRVNDDNLEIFTKCLNAFWAEQRVPDSFKRMSVAYTKKERPTILKTIVQSPCSILAIRFLLELFKFVSRLS